ncbi:hypothetical protein CP533_1681 [Ophiocordyceps camponoti-saundersi (nom. inval.)]|nr:hypothetical protein CP533_1681 [Ophiocordyceps camponoti-saundersi (nom. inval.)]
MLSHLNILLLLLLCMAGSSSGEVNYLALIQRRDDHLKPLHPRQTGTSISGGGGEVSQECFAAAESVFSSIPSPPPEIRSAIMRDMPTNPCDFTTPASLTSQFSSYSSVLASWASANENKLSACSAMTTMSAFTDCSRKAAATSAPSSTTDAAAATGTRTGNSAARQTGVGAVAYAAVAAAAAVGAAAVL